MQVTSETTLVKLHRILQRVMGWEGSHLYQFVIGGIAYGEPGMLGELDVKDARTVTLDTLVRGEKSKFLYEYDFGDSWEHELLVEKILPLEEGKRYPVCLTGKRACPPRIAVASGDTPISWKRSEIRSTPSTRRCWNGVGGEFDPEAFDLEEVNTELQRLTSSEVGRRRRWCGTEGICAASSFIGARTSFTTNFYKLSDFRSLSTRCLPRDCGRNVTPWPGTLKTTTDR